MFIFFVNKPSAIIPYLIGLVILFYVGLFDDMMPSFMFVSSICFSFWYYVGMVRFYILGGNEELIIWDVKINQFRPFLNFTLILEGAAIIFASLVTLERGNGFIPAFLLGFFTVMSFIILHKIIFAKFISQGLKYHSSLRDMSIDDVYKQIREIAIKKLIKSE